MHRPSETRATVDEIAPARRARRFVLPGLLAAGLGLVALGIAIDDLPRGVPAAPATPNAPTVDPTPGETPDTVRRPSPLARPGKTRAAEAEDSDFTADGLSTPAVPRIEREFLAEFEALARRDPRAFALRADAVLAGVGPACEKIALLRAAYATGGANVPALFARAVATLPADADPRGESVPGSALAWLRRRATSEVLARAVLEEVIWSETWAARPAWREQALRTLLLASAEADMPRLRARVLAERDRDVFEAGLAALDDRASPPADQPIAQDIPD